MANLFGTAAASPYNPASMWSKSQTNPLGAQGPYAGGGLSTGSINTTGIPIKLAPFPTQQTATAPAPVTPYNIAPFPTPQQADVTPLSAKQTSPFQTGFGSTGAVMPNPNDIASKFTSAINKAGAPKTPPATTPPPANAPFDFSSLPNIQAYMNPYLDQIINKGNQAIQSSAAAKGLLGSSGTINDIGTWTGDETAKGWQQAFDNFNTDRNFGANRSDEDWKRYAQQQGIDANNYQFEQGYRTQNYNSQVNAFNKLMANKQANMQALSEGGPKMAELAADLAVALGQSEANIYTALAQLKAEGYVGQANAQGNLLGQAGGIIGMLL